MAKNKLINQNIRSGRHCVFNLHAHLVFVTKYRRKIFTANAINTLRDLFKKVCDDFNSTLVEVDGEDDHVHLLIHYPPQIALSKLVNSLKGVSSRMLRLKHPELKRHYLKQALWSPSYFAASCSGAPISVIKQYIEQQKTPA